VFERYNAAAEEARRRYLQDSSISLSLRSSGPNQGNPPRLRGNIVPDSMMKSPLFPPQEQALAESSATSEQIPAATRQTS
jgi:hypothetical protein